MTPTTCIGSVRFNRSRSSGQRLLNQSAAGASMIHASQITSCDQNVRQAMLNVPGGGGPLRRIGGSSTRIVPAENMPSTTHSTNSKTQIIPGLRISPAAKELDNVNSLGSDWNYFTAFQMTTVRVCGETRNSCREPWALRGEESAPDHAFSTTGAII